MPIPKLIQFHHTVPSLTVSYYGHMRDMYRGFPDDYKLPVRFLKLLDNAYATKKINVNKLLQLQTFIRKTKNANIVKAINAAKKKKKAAERKKNAAKKAAEKREKAIEKAAEKKEQAIEKAAMKLWQANYDLKARNKLLDELQQVLKPHNLETLPKLIKTRIRVAKQNPSIMRTFRINSLIIAWKAKGSKKQVPKSTGACAQVAYACHIGNENRRFINIHDKRVYIDKK